MQSDRDNRRTAIHESQALYSKAVHRLREAQGPWPPSDILQCLLLRDVIAHRYAAGEISDGQEAKEILTADAALAELAPRLAKTEEFAAWRERFSPPESAWWWHPEICLRGPQRLDSLWNTLTLFLVAAAIGVATDVAHRFSFGSIDIWGELFVVLSALLAALSGGSILSVSLRTRLHEVFDLVKIPDAYRGLLTLFSAIFFLAAVVGVWFARPAISRHYNDRGAVALISGRLAEAEVALQTAVRLKPTNALAHYNLGSLYEDLLQPDTAKAHYQIAFAAGEIRASNNLGRLYLLERKPELAVEVLLRASEHARDPREVLEIGARYDILKNLGWARLEQRRFLEARDYLEEAVHLLPNEAEARCLLAKLFTAQEKPDLARAEWEGCLAAADPQVREQDRWLSEAKAFLAQQDTGERQ